MLVVYLASIPAFVGISNSKAACDIDQKMLTVPSEAFWDIYTSEFSAGKSQATISEHSYQTNFAFRQVVGSPILCVIFRFWSFHPCKQKSSLDPPQTFSSTNASALFAPVKNVVAFSNGPIWSSGHRRIELAPRVRRPYSRPHVADMDARNMHTMTRVHRTNRIENTLQFSNVSARIKQHHFFCAFSYEAHGTSPRTFVEHPFACTVWSESVKCCSQLYGTVSRNNFRHFLLKEKAIKFLAIPLIVKKSFFSNWQPFDY